MGGGAVGGCFRQLDVVLAFVYQALLEHESVSPWSVLGAALIVSCIFMIAYRKCKEQPADPKPSRHNAATRSVAMTSSGIGKHAVRGKRGRGGGLAAQDGGGSGSDSDSASARGDDSRGTGVIANAGDVHVDVEAGASDKRVLPYDDGANAVHVLGSQLPSTLTHHARYLTQSWS